MQDSLPQFNSESLILTAVATPKSKNRTTKSTPDIATSSVHEYVDEFNIMPSSSQRTPRSERKIKKATK